MQLLALVLIAGVTGYLLAGSRFRKPIDETANRVTDTTRGAADRVENSVRGVFSRRRKPASTVIEGTAVEPTPTAVPATPPAEKQPSRRHSETDTGAVIE